MALRRLSHLILLAALAVAGAAFAQSEKVVPLDRVLVVVNDEAITQWDLNEQRRVVMSQLKVPIITTIIGEGGSGGALAIAVADHVLMLQYATYSVISPEGCASILWKSAAKAPEAAEALGLTAHRLKALGLIDKIVAEPLGGAHRDPKQMAALLKRALADSLRQFQGVKTKDLLAARHEKLMSCGKFKETTSSE